MSGKFYAESLDWLEASNQYSKKTVKDRYLNDKNKYDAKRQLLREQYYADNEYSKDTPVLDKQMKALKDEHTCKSCGEFTPPRYLDSGICPDCRG
jgi:hypothetical protein